MPTVNCPYCGTPHQSAGAPPANCRMCGKQISSSSSNDDVMDLMLKEVVTCPKCSFEFYEEDLADGCCPRCQREISLAGDEPEEEEEEEEEEPATRGRGRGRGKTPGRKGRGGARGSGAGKIKKSKKKSKKQSKPQAPPPKKKVILSEEFKSQVFAAFRRADAREAQRLCFELTGENEDHAKQIYGYLLGIAKKKNWIGIDKGSPDDEATVNLMPEVPGGPMHGAPMGHGPPLGQPMPGQPMPGQPLPGQPLAPLPLPAGILSPGGPAMPGGPGPMGPAPGQPLEPLPLPAGILDPAGGPAPLPGLGQPTMMPPQPGMPGQPFAGDPTVRLSPQVASGIHALPNRLDHSLDGSDPPSNPATRAQQELLPPKPIPLPEPGVPLQRAPVASPTQTAPAAEGAEPDERGFLARVAIEGRAAQVSLLCMAGRYSAAKDMAQSTLTRDPYSARGHAALGEALAGLGEDAQALQAFSNGIRADPNDVSCVRGYAQMLSRVGRYQEAVGAYHRIVGPGKGALRDAVALAAALRKAGNVAGAQRVIEEVVKRDPQSLEPMRQSAEAQAAAGNMDGAGSLLGQLLDKEQPPYTLALALAESIVGRCGPSIPARISCARVFTAVGRPFDAVRLMGPLAAQQPANLDIRRALGLAYAALGAGPQAEEHLMAVVKGGAGGAQEYRALGTVYLDRGDTASCIKALIRARDTRPNDVDTRRALARALAAQGDLDGAIRELRQAHAGSDDTTLEDELDRITERAFTKRVKELEARLMANDEDSSARLELAAALAQRGDLLEAVEHLKRVCKNPELMPRALAAAEHMREENPDARPIIVLLSTLYDLTEAHEQAIQVLEAYMENNAEDHELRLQLYDQYTRGNRTQDAVVGLRAYLEDENPFDLERALELGEQLLEGRGSQALALSLGRGRRRLGQLDPAVALFQRYLEGEPEDTDARVELARMLESAGRWGEAYDVLKVLVEGNAGSTAELERLASLALAAGKIDDAVALLKRAVDRHPEDLALRHALDATEARLRRQRIQALTSSQRPEDKLELAALHVEEGNKNEAVQLLRALNKLDDNPELSFLRFSAEHFAKVGKPERAEAALRQVGRALNYQPASDGHKDMLYRIATVHERAGPAHRPGARRVFLELYAQDPQFRDVGAKLEGLSEDVHGGHTLDERVLDLVDVGAPLGTVFDTLQTFDLSLDPRLLAQGYSSSVRLRAQERQ